MRLIDADHLMQIVCSATILSDGFKAVFRKLVAGEPTIDRPTRSQFKRMAVQLGYEEVIHCKDCEFAEPYERMDGETGYYCRHPKHSFVYDALRECEFNPVKEKNDFCSYGERRSDEKV